MFVIQMTLPRLSGEGGRRREDKKEGRGRKKREVENREKGNGDKP